MPTRKPALIFQLPALLWLFSAPLLADGLPVEIVESLDGSRIVAFVNESDLDTASIWQPGEGAPKLTIAKALQAVNAHIAADPDISSAQLVEIKLEQIPNHAGHWNYLLKLQTVNHAQHTSYYVVLMNGRVVPAVREPSSIK